MANVITSFSEALILKTLNVSLGSIETNIETVLEAVKEKSKQYQDITKYEVDDKQAKEDRALLRKQREMTKTTISSIQEMWNKPLDIFMDGGKQIIKQFDYAIDAIDEWVKGGEEKEREKKREAVQNYFNSKDFKLVTLDQIFDHRWLNKTYELKDIKENIDIIISDIYLNIKTLESIAEYGMAAKAFYLETLDIGASMRRIETMKANALKLAEEKTERDERERGEQLKVNIKEELKEEKEIDKERRISKLAASALELNEPVIEKPEIIEFTLKFRGTRKQLLKLREFMTENGIAYMKI